MNEPVVFQPVDSVGSMDCVNVTIVDETVVEIDETFLISLTSDDPAVNPYPTEQATVTIINDDCKPLYQ